TNQGEDIQASLTIELEDSAFGREKEIHLKRAIACERCQGSGAEPKSETISCAHCSGTGEVRKQFRTPFGTMAQNTTCTECHGRGKVPKHKCTSCNGQGIKHATDTFTVKIPPGIETGEAFGVAGKGNAAPFGGGVGNLYISVSIAKHPAFTRHGDDLHMKTTVGISQAVFGDKAEVQTLHGAINLKIPAGIQSGTIIRVEGKGMPRRAGYGKGDLLVAVNIHTPTKLTRRQKELLEELKKEGI
ncbi:MAG: J domain-containing protein, partial [Patescibacteria group bacterium]